MCDHDKAGSLFCPGQTGLLHLVDLLRHLRTFLELSSVKQYFIKTIYIKKFNKQ